MSADRAPAGTRTPGTSSAPQTKPAPSPTPSVALPEPGAAGEIPDTARLRQLALQPGETAGVAEGESGSHPMHAGELRPLSPSELSAPCSAMWGLLSQRGARAAVSQTFATDTPGNPQVNFLASYAGAEAVYTRLRSAVAACPSDSEDGRTVTVRYEDLDGAGFPEDTIRIRMTTTDEGSTGPADVIDRVVTRVGACIADLSGLGSEPYPRLAEGPVLRQIERLRTAQGL
ncbi:hypothetical protein ABZZ17_30310 [Streptomyces sp. NPDC006512]|uniref:hypothetical protein n=1 Tax=Streptomyces sp. NPDC006512 TaxID=3154307 RepID=UPI0033B85C93